MICLTATATRLSVVQYTHAGIKETADAGLITIIGARICDFNDGATLNLFGTEYTELNTDDRL